MPRVTPRPARYRHFKHWGVDWSDDWYIPEPNSGCWLWLGPMDHRGYGTIGASDYAHRYAWKRFCGEIPQGMFVLHRCDTPLCINPDHLFLGTQTENLADMWRKGRGRSPKGDKNGRWRGGITLMPGYKKQYNQAYYRKHKDG